MRPDLTKYYKLIMPDGSYSYFTCSVGSFPPLLRFVYKTYDIIKVSKAKYDHEVAKIEKIHGPWEPE